MTREFKSVGQHIKAISGRTVTGIFSVAGNIDSYGDKMWPGAFSKTLQERGKKTLFLWQHDFELAPTAMIETIREITREELPEEVLAVAPMALGGCEVTRTYLDTPRGNEALACLTAGAPLQMSFGYDAVKFDFEEDATGLSPWGQIRNLREVQLYEVSDVLWGANDATTASKAPLDAILRQLGGLLRDIKAGSRHSAADVKLINDIHRMATELGATNCAGIASDTPDPDSDEPKTMSRADATASLTLLRSKLDLLSLSL